MLYAGESRFVCYLESLDQYRPFQALLQQVAIFGPDSFTPRTGLVPASFFTRLVGWFRLDPGQRWLDLRISAPETAVALSREHAIATVLPELGYGPRFKPGDLLGSDRRLTQMVARWAYEQGYAGLTYSCSHRPTLDCWAIFEGASFSVIGKPATIDPADPEVIAVAREFGLTISFAHRPAHPS